MKIDRDAPTVVVNGRVPVDHKVLLFELAAKNRMGISEYISYLLMSHCLDCQKKEKETKEKGGELESKRIIDIGTEIKEPPEVIRKIREDEKSREHFLSWRHEKRVKEARLKEEMLAKQSKAEKEKRKSIGLDLPDVGRNGKITKNKGKKK